MIPFLLLTAVFVRIAVVELSLPTLSRRGGLTKQQGVIVTILAVKEDGFQLKSTELKFSDIPKRAGSYDYEQLVRRLKEVKSKHAATEDIIISPDANIKYEIIIKVMDRCRETGFSNISISG